MVKPKLKLTDNKLKEPELETKSLVEDALKKTLQKYPYEYSITINEDEEKILLKQINDYIEAVEKKRGEWDLYDRWQEARDQYSGIVEDKDFPWEDCSNLHIGITSMSVDILNTKAQAQMYVDPMMLLKPLPGQQSETLYQDVELKEKFLNNKVLEEIEIADISDNILEDAINIGTGIMGIRYLRQIDFDALELEIYEPTAEDIMRFEEDFGDSKDTESYKKYTKDLMAGEPVEVWYEKDEILKDSPELYHVKLEDLYLMPDVDDIDRQRMIPEKIEFSWLQLVNYVETKYFEGSILKYLRDKYTDDYYKRKYPAFQTICYYDYEKNNRPKKIVATALADESGKQCIKLIKTITYPYIHREAYYSLYYIKRISGSIYGEGLAEKLKHTNKALNNLWNQTVDSGTYRNLPMLKGVKTEMEDVTMKTPKPGAVWYLKQIGALEVLHMGGQYIETINYIARLERYAEWLSGVSAYMTGRESPLDPNAPASKAFMLLKESNLRVNKSIQSLHRSNKRTFKQIDKLIYQYARGTKLPYLVRSGEEFKSKDIDRKLLGIKVDYVPHLSDITINKEAENQQDMGFAVYLQSRPLIQQNPGSEEVILETLIRNKGGIWEKNLDKLLPQLKKPEGWGRGPGAGPGRGPGAGIEIGGMPIPYPPPMPSPVSPEEAGY